MQNRIKHLAIIMDGNGRWAQSRGMTRLKGHEMGAHAARNIVEAVKLRGIGYLTLYAFSSENWNRPREEVEGLFKLLEGFIDREVYKLKESGVRLHIIGDISRFPASLQEKIMLTLHETRDNHDISLCVALNYGGRDEIIRAVQKIMRSGITADDVDDKVISDHLDTAFIPDPDLLIRTGGEWRISNFLLWQLAYTEIYFTDTLWPDFNEEALDAAIAWYSTRERRFGMTSEQIRGLNES